MNRCGFIGVFLLCAWMLCGCGVKKGDTDVKNEEAALRFIPFDDLDAQGYWAYRALFD